MKITRVGYGETVSDGNYNNVRTWFETDLEEGENPETAIETLRAKCFSITNVRNEILHLEEEKRRLGRDIYQLRCAYTNAKQSWDYTKAQWERLLDWAKIQGFEVKAQFPSDPDLYNIDSSSKQTDNNDDVGDEESDDDLEENEDD